MLLPSLKQLSTLGFKLVLFVSAVMLPATEPARGESCKFEHQSGQGLACTGNEVRITFADNIRNVLGTPLNQCSSGQRFSFVADFHVQTTAKASYDVGLFFATDGDPNRDGAKSDTCAANIIKDRHRDPVFPHAIMLGADVAANLDGNDCRDVTAAYGWRNIGGKVVTLRVNDALCQDSDGDGKVNLPNCTSWSLTARGQCSLPKDTVANSPITCNCDIAFNLPVLAIPANNQLTKDDPPVPSGESRRNVSLLLEAKPPKHSDP